MNSPTFSATIKYPDDNTFLPLREVMLQQTLQQHINNLRDALLMRGCSPSYIDDIQLNGYPFKNL